MNLVDLLLAGYITWGIWRGSKRGMTEETTRLILLLVAVLTGYGVARWTNRGLHALSVLGGRGLGPITGLCIMIASYVLFRQMRDRIRTHLNTWFPQPRHQQQGGMIAGGCRTLVAGATAVVFIGLLPLGFLAKPFNTGSLVGRTLILNIVPVYDSIAGSNREPQPSAPSPKSPRHQPPTPDRKH